MMMMKTKNFKKKLKSIKIYNKNNKNNNKKIVKIK